MQPTRATAEVALLHPVVTNIKNTISSCFQPLQYSGCYEFAIRGSPTPSVVVAGQIAHSFIASVTKSAESELCHVFPQDCLAESTRSTVDTKVHDLSINPKPIARFSTLDAFHCLQFGEVVAAANCAEAM